MSHVNNRAAIRAVIAIHADEEPRDIGDRLLGCG